MTWLINEVMVLHPTREQLLLMQPLRDYAVVKPPPSKADQWGTVWGHRPIHLVFDPSQELNAAGALRELELSFPVEAAQRRTTPLFMNDNRTPLTGPYMDKLIKGILLHLGEQQYSWHSYRAALACSMLEAGASEPQILAVCRWQTAESLHTYATMSAKAYNKLLAAAYARDFTQIHPNDLPFSIGLDSMVQQLQGLEFGDEA